MEKYLKKDFDFDHKNPSEEAMRKWRSAVSLVKNPRRRFRFVADLAKRSEAEKKKLKIQVYLLLIHFTYILVFAPSDSSERTSVRSKNGIVDYYIPSKKNKIKKYNYAVWSLRKGGKLKADWIQLFKLSSLLFYQPLK